MKIFSLMRRDAANQIGFRVRTKISDCIRHQFRNFIDSGHILIVLSIVLKLSNLCAAQTVSLADEIVAEG